MSARREAPLAALAVYAAASLLLFGRPVLRHPGASYVGYGNDAEVFIWMLRWWPHALSHGDNPFITSAVWAPSGVNLAWVTSVPGAALLLWPLTAAAGPIVSYNVAILAAPALSAWAAFLLCRHVCGNGWAALAGGYAYGFSSYELGHVLGHLNLAMLPCPPLVALVLLRACEGELDRRGTLLRLVPLLVLQFLLSIEVFLTLALASAIVLALAWWLLPGRRGALRRTARDALLGGLACAVIVSPYLYEALAHLRIGAINSPFTFSADLLNPLVPTRLTLLGGSAAGTVSDRFRGDLAEDGAYLGLALVAVVALFARERWREREARVLLLALGVAVLLELGPLLTIAGVRVAPLPWLPLAFTPLVEHVLPVRLAAYAALAAALVLALWLARGRAPLAARVALGAVVVVSLVPDTGAPYWHAPLDLPALFRPGGGYQTAIPRNANVLVLPFAGAGHGMLWQAATGFWFRQAAGYTGPKPPSEVAGDPAVQALVAAVPGAPSAAAAPALAAFARRRGIDLIAVEDAQAATFGPLLDALHVPSQHVGGVTLYRMTG